MSRKTIIIIIVATVCVVFFIVALAVFGRKEKQTVYNLDLTVWGTFDNTSDYSAIFNAYSAAHPFIDGVDYRKFVIETYKDDLLSALAAGNGPDIFMIHNTWLPEFVDKIVPAPVYIIDEQAYRTHLVDVAAQDGMIDSQIYAVPLSVDALALYYNKDIFNAAGITAPPTTWEEFSEDVMTITRRDDESSRILQSGAAIGTAKNINRPTDILTALMMQGGAEMSSNGQATFDKAVTINGEVRTPGKRALLYYTQFARITDKALYTWNDAQHYSLDAFAEGQTAMMFNYSWHYDTLKSKNDKFNFAVAPLPQIDASSTRNHVNYANYWMFVVAKNKELPTTEPAKGKVAVTDEMRVHEAWQFLRTIALPSGGDVSLSNAATGDLYTVRFPFDLTQQYLEETGKPAARFDLIEKQKSDVRLAPFATGNLIARSWVHPNAEAVERIIAEMITQVNTGANTVDDALELAAQRATQLMK